MRPVRRDELLDLGAYESIRDQFRARIIAAKRARYVSIGEHVTALFENRDSVLYQIQEMLRTERITQEKAILHELETYNELVPGEHELSATIFVEYEDRNERDRMLVELAGLEQSFFVVAGNARASLIPDPRSDDPTRTMAVQYVKFVLDPDAERVVRSGTGPVVIGVEHPSYRAKTSLAPETLKSLSDDFESQ